MNKQEEIHHADLVFPGVIDTETSFFLLIALIVELLPT